jgi:aminopeptidase YwaD
LKEIPMKKIFTGMLLFVLLALSACGGQEGPTVTVAELPPTPTFAATSEETPSAIVSDFDAARAFKNTRKLAVDIGKRVAGTEGGETAANYIAEEFEASGLKVIRQPFTFEGWEDHGTTVQVTSPESIAIEAHAIQYSVGGDASGEIVNVPGLGNPEDFAKVNVRGKIALVRRGVTSFSAKAQNAAKAGATAILIYNEKPSTYTGTLRDEVTIPTIGISGAAGQQILNLLSEGKVQAKVSSDSGVETRTGYNVIGTIPGKTDETIVLGGHYDSVPAGPGAGDNASGTAVFIELARAMAGKAQPNYTLVFIAFDAEELGLLGSRAYVNDLSDEQLGKIRAMLNFDMLGAGGGPLILMGDGDVALLARSSAQELGIDARNGNMPSNAGSDHESFARRGVDTVFFMRNYDLLHTPEDTIDQVKQEYLDEAGRVAERVLERMDEMLRHDSSKLMPTE